MLRDAKEIGGPDLYAAQSAACMVEKSDTDGHANDRQIDEIDLRELVCSAIHEYRVHGAPLELFFVDEHPYAIIRGERARAIAIVHAFFDFALQESSARRLTVRLYSMGEELYVEVAAEAEYPERTAAGTSKEERLDPEAEPAGRCRLELSKGWLRFSNSSERGATLAMSFSCS